MENSSYSKLRLEDLSQTNNSETPRASLIESTSDFFTGLKSKSRHISFLSPNKSGNSQSFFSAHTRAGSSYISPTNRYSFSISQDHQSLKVLDEKLTKITEELISERNTGRDTAWETGRDRILDSQHESKFYISTERSALAKEISDNNEFADFPCLRWCAFCGKETSTEIEYKNSSTTFWASLGIFLAGGVFGCFLLPYGMNSCKDMKTVCHICKREVLKVNDT
ncbi:hypothetical protein SteCoe_1784 [Stentor coeruleus]|uniref:LITAF domain-containing protein n=1 Tax=Stentor coeruleus TaxID=5963 RepID=A0A1R2D0Z4_9CILI|nr:hypothetical protein SteCoe_1784 [Stentor coeruleus]